MNFSSRVLPIVVILAIAVVGYLVSGWISLGNLRPLTLTVSFAAVLGFTIVILKKWQVGVFIFFIWIVLEDLLRKYIGNDMILYLVKDVLMILVYIAYFVPRLLNWRQESRVRSPLLVPLVIWFVWALAEAFNPGVDHPLVPLVGLRMSFFYIPMIYLGYSFALAESRLMVFLKLNIFLGTIVASLGIAQAILGLEFLNPAGFVPYLRLYLVRAVTDTGATVPRPNSVFTDAGRFAQYLYVMVILCLGTLASGRLAKGTASRRRSAPAWIWVSLLILSAGLFVSGQRAAIYLLGLAVPVLVMFRCYEARTRRGATSAMPLVKIGLLLVAGFMCLWALFPQRVQATYDFYTKTLLPENKGFEVPYRVNSLVWQFKYALSQAPLVGHGTGTNSLGRQYLYHMTDFYSPTGSLIEGVEMGYGALVWEWGIVGLAIWIWWGFGLARQSLSITLSLAGGRFFWLAVMISYFLFSIVFLWLFLGLQVYQNYVTAAFLWFLAGVLLRLPKIAEESPRHES